MNMPQAVIFDMDGVIVDSEPRHERAFREVLRAIGYGDDHGFAFSEYIGRSDTDLWVDFVAKYKPAHTLEQLLQMKQKLVLEIIRREEPLFNGLPELIQSVSTRYRLAVASGSDPAVVEAVLALQGLRRFFQAVVSAVEVRNGKPAPDIFLRSAELLDVPPANCWVIEDSKPGVAAGLAAGMKVIAITNTHSAEDLKRATHVVSTYGEIERLLLGEG